VRARARSDLLHTFSLRERSERFLCVAQKPGLLLTLQESASDSSCRRHSHSPDVEAWNLAFTGHPILSLAMKRERSEREGLPAVEAAGVGIGEGTASERASWCGFTGDGGRELHETSPYERTGGTNAAKVAPSRRPGRPRPVRPGDRPHASTGFCAIDQAGLPCRLHPGFCGSLPADCERSAQVCRLGTDGGAGRVRRRAGLVIAATARPPLGVDSPRTVVGAAAGTAPAPSQSGFGERVGGRGKVIFLPEPASPPLATVFLHHAEWPGVKGGAAAARSAVYP
jgi:hypothetical protein